VTRYPQVHRLSNPSPRTPYPTYYGYDLTITHVSTNVPSGKLMTIPTTTLVTKGSVGTLRCFALNLLPTPLLPLRTGR